MTDFALSDTLVISDDHLTTVCKYRQADCCKYIVAFPHSTKKGLVDFFCVKNVPDLKKTIDETEMKAENDNCEGLISETRT